MVSENAWNFSSERCRRNELQLTNQNEILNQTDWRFHSNRRQPRRSQDSELPNDFALGDGRQPLVDSTGAGENVVDIFTDKTHVPIDEQKLDSPVMGAAETR